MCRQTVGESSSNTGVFLARVNDFSRNLVEAWYRAAEQPVSTTRVHSESLSTLLRSWVLHMWRCAAQLGLECMVVWCLAARVTVVRVPACLSGDVQHVRGASAHARILLHAP